MTTKTTYAPERCPRRIIEATADERIEFFKRYIANHQHLNAAYGETIAAIGRSTGPRVVIVTGPTGAGKTTLARHIYKSLVLAHKDQTAADRGFVPVAGISAVPPNGSCFSWKDLYVRLLSGHGDVMIDRKLMVPTQGEIFANPTIMSPLERSATDSLRRALESGLKHRRTKVLIIDEAHHILMVKDPARLEYQFEALKSLTIETDVTIVLVGTYRLLDIRDQSGQLVRRSEIVHMPRYDVRDRHDAAAFASALDALAHQLPLREVPDFSEDLDYLYTKTAGCIGILKDSLARCLERAIANGSQTITADDFDKVALPNKALRTIIEEAMAGENKLKDEDISGLQTLLRTGIPGVITASGGKRPNSGGTRARVGERLPVRDPVGGMRDVAP